MPPHAPPNEPCIHICTYGEFYGPPPRLPFPQDTPPFTIPCIHLPAPSKPLCDYYTGLDRPLSSAFFSNPANEAYFRQQRAALAAYIVHPAIASQGRCVVVWVSCRAGMHRSVAVAERFARELRRGRWGVECRHLDLERSVARREERLVRERDLSLGYPLVGERAMGGGGWGGWGGGYGFNGYY